MQKLIPGRIVDWLPDEDAFVLMTGQGTPNETSLNRVDTRTQKFSWVESPKLDVVAYITDGRGTVRVRGIQDLADRSGTQTGVYHFSYRKPGSRDWQKLSDYRSQTGDGFMPLAVDRERNLAYGFKKVDGRKAIGSIALDGSMAEGLVFARPDVDVDGLVKIGRSNRIVGTAYQTDTPQVAYTDPDIERVVTSLAKALPKQPYIRILDTSFDERKLLIFAGSDDDPGAYYLFDRDKHDLHVLMDARPQLAGRSLAVMKPIQYRAGDGTMIPAYLTLPPGVIKAEHLPAIVMPHGGPASRDQWGFNWLSQFFASQGYVVMQPEFRGSSGYGDAWFQQNGFKSWRVAVGDIAEAGRWLIAQGIADPDKLTIVGWSYGGYAALQAAVVDPGLFKGVVAIAPVTDLATLKSESLGWTDNDLARRFVGSGPEIRDGSPAQNAEKIKVPVLLIHGTEDANVGYAESVLMQSRLQAAGGKVRLITFKGLDHQLDDPDARKTLLSESDAFLRAAISR